MNLSYRLFIVGMLITGLSAFIGAVESSKTERLVTVNGQGKISAVPDQAQLRIEVMEEGPKVEAVNQEVRQAMENILKTLKAQGVPEKDLQTQAYHVAPKMEWHNGRSSRVGFTVSNQVLATVKDLKKVGAVLAAALDAGANNVSGPDFGFQDSKELERKALALAVEDAKAKASLLAHTAGALLGPIMTLQEISVQRPGPRPVFAARMLAMEKSSADVPIATGEETIEAMVNAGFSLK